MKNGKTYILARWQAPVPAPDSARSEPDHRIGLLAKQESFDCVFLATQCNLKVKTIARVTHLSEATVRYRLKAAGFSISDHREGKGIYAPLLAHHTHDRKAAINMTQILREHLSRKQIKL